MKTSGSLVAGLQPHDEHTAEIRILQAAQADMSLFAPLYEQYAPRIYAYCLRRLRNGQEAEDVTSQIFARALGALDDYQGGSVAAWLFRIAHNAVISHIRVRRPQVALDEMEDDLPTEADDLIESLSAGEAQRRIRQFVRALPEDEQQLIALKVTAGLTAEEVGAVLGKSAGAVRVEYHRIIKRLRVYFGQDMT
jgi:RNA polymerase sigma-70 factor (ECF subfamily)